MFIIDGRKQQDTVLQFGTKAEILARTGKSVGETWWVSDIASDPSGATAVWSGSDWIGFLRSEKLENL